MSYHRASKVRWFQTWDPVIEQALAGLSESEACPHDLLELLMRNRAGPAKRTALVTVAGRPVAVVPLVREGRHWRNVGDASFPASEGLRDEVISALKVNHLTYYSRTTPAAGLKNLRDAWPETVYETRPGSDPEVYWRQSGHHKTIRLARNRCSGLVCEIDAPGSVEWTIEALRVLRRWRDKWIERGSAEASRWRDVPIKQQYHFDRGRQHVLTLLDGDRRVAGLTGLVLGDCLTWHTIVRDPAYDDRMVGNRIYDLGFTWAHAQGIRRVSIGSGAPYKERWAPPAGVMWNYRIAPWRYSAARALLRFATTGARRLIGAAARR